MTRLLLSGAAGRMGREIAALSTQYGFEIVAGVDVNTSEKTAFPLYSSYTLCQEKAEAIIDFSQPAHLMQTLRCAQERRIPLLLGTTGLDTAHERMLDETSQKIPLLQAANFSLGMQVLLHAAKLAAQRLPGFDIEIIERHHAHKADAPGGTAMMLYNAVAQPQSQAIYGRHTALQKRKKAEIALHSVRGGTLCGTHEIGLYGQDEHLLLVHEAESRAVFAHGALKAMHWLMQQPPGRYRMDDLFS